MENENELNLGSFEDDNTNEDIENLKLALMNEKVVCYI